MPSTTTPRSSASSRYNSRPTIRKSGDAVRRPVGGTVRSKSTSGVRILHDKSTSRIKAERIKRSLDSKYERAKQPTPRSNTARSPRIRTQPRSGEARPSFANRRYPVAAKSPKLRSAATAPRRAPKLVTRAPASNAVARGVQPITPTLGNRPARGGSTYYAPTYTPSKKSVYGHAHWGGHYSTLSFAFGIGHRARWGCYSYPYYYCASLPGYYDHCWSSYGYYGRHVGLRYCTSFWPRSSLCWGLPLFGSYWSHSYDVYYNPGPSYVVINESSPSTVVASAGAKEESLEDLVARHLSLGDYYFQEGRYEDAAESYFRALAYAPDDGSIHFVIADALFAQGDYHFAAHMLQKGLQFDPWLIHAEADKRDFYGDPKDFTKQLATLRRYLTEKPYDAAAYSVLGYNLWFSGERGAAREAFERVREIDPANQIATAFLDDLEAPKTDPEAARDGVK